MRALVIYDSFFGNTERIARAIGNALGSQDEVKVLRVGDAQSAQLTGLRLLFVGSPTRGFRPSEATALWLNSLPANGLQGIDVAAFDTRIAAADAKPAILRFVLRFGQYAAKPIADRLVQKGGRLVLPPEGFYVLDTEGPLKDGEIERAAAWAKRVAQM